MGIEYRIRFPADPAELDGDLRALRCFSDFDPRHHLYNLRSVPAPVSGMPNGWVRIEPGGLYFCDSGGSAAEQAIIFRSIIELSLKRSRKVEIEGL